MNKYFIIIVMVLGLVLVACNSQDEDENVEIEDVNNIEQNEEIDENEVEKDDVSDEESHSSDPVESNDDDVGEAVGEVDEQNEVLTSLDEASALQIIDEFQNRMFVETDDELLVLDFNTLDELIEYMGEYGDTDLVSSFVDQFYYEDDQGVYLIPQSSPPTLDIHDPVTFEALSDTRYLISQEDQSEAYGEVTFNILIELIDDKFKITNYGIQ